MIKHIICPAIYRHWRGMNHATMYESIPVSKEIYSGFKYCKKLIAWHTETRKRVFLKVNNEGQCYHIDSYCNERLVIYKDLYNDKTMPYARPLSSFAGKVPEENETGQEYRFELIR